MDYFVTDCNIQIIFKGCQVYSVKIFIFIHRIRKNHKTFKIMSIETAKSWFGEHYIRPYDLNPNGQLSLKGLCDYFQDAADQHAYVLGFGFDQIPSHLAWVMLRLRVEMEQYPKWRESVRVETSPNNINRLFAYRDYWLWSAEGNLLGKATSQWIMIDVERRRPVRILDWVQDLHLNDSRRSISELPTLAQPQSFDFETTFRVRYSDMDIMGHTNNAVYANMIAESVPLHIIQNKQLKTLDVHFKAESKFNDMISSQTEQISESTFRHQLIRQSDNALLVLGYSEWM
jgi:acyl-ACP thioesterase